MANALSLGGLVAAGVQALRAEVTDIDTQGLVEVHCADGRRLACECLLSSPWSAVAPGDTVLVLLLDSGAHPLVVGRIGRLSANEADPVQVRISAREQMTLACGESSIDLRADGKVVIKGDDVLVRAKGTKRIRAGTVSIN